MPDSVAYEVYNTWFEDLAELGWVWLHCSDTVPGLSGASSCVWVGVMHSGSNWDFCPRLDMGRVPYVILLHVSVSILGPARLDQV